MKKQTILLLAVFASAVFLPRVADSAGLVPCTNDCNLCYLMIGISNIFKWLMGSMLTIAVLAGITIAGVLYIISGPFPKMLELAKKSLEGAFKGFVLAMTCWIIINSVMILVGYKHPTGGKWWEFECSTAGTPGQKNEQKCDPKNKILQSVRIQCAAGSGEYISLDPASDLENKEEKDDKYQLTALGKYSCKKDDGTTEESEEDITQKADWKASDETQIKVNKGLVQAISKEVTGTSPPYVEAAYENKKSNAMKVYIGSCPVVAIDNNPNNPKNISFGNIIATAKAQNVEEKSGSDQQSWGDYLRSWYNYATTPKNKKIEPLVSTPTSKCKNACPTDSKKTCHFVYGNENNPKAILLLQRANIYNGSNLLQQCQEFYGNWKEDDSQQLKIFTDLVKKMSRGIDSTANKNDLAVWESDLIDTKDPSCPKLPTAFGYILNRKAVGSFRNEAHAGPPSYYCLNDSRASFLLAHEQLGHDYAGLSDEYIECSKNTTSYCNTKKNYNCTSKNNIQSGLISAKTKWGSISFPAPYFGCAYHSSFMRSSYGSIMNSGIFFNGAFGDVNDRIIKFKLQNNTEPAQWAETLNSNEVCK